VKLLAYRVFDPIAAPLLTKEPFDGTAEIARRAYKLYERRGRQGGRDVYDWLQAEREIRQNED